jgi:MFS family permease
MQANCSSYLGYLSDRLGSRIIAFTSFTLLSIPLICLRLVNENTTLHITILCLILSSVGLCVDLGEPALVVEIQRVLDDMETKDPGIFGEKGAIAQAFSLHSMAHFGGLAIGPIAGGFFSLHFGWNAMTLALGILALVTAVPMLWLSGARGVEAGEDAERAFTCR